MLRCTLKITEKAFWFLVLYVFSQNSIEFNTSHFQLLAMTYFVFLIIGISTRHLYQCIPNINIAYYISNKYNKNSVFKLKYIN